MSASATDDLRLRLAGTYRLGSITARIGDGPFTDIYEHAPTGYAIITPTRFMAVITAGGRHFGTNPPEEL